MALRLRRSKVARIILGLLILGGLMTMAAIAPNAIQALKLFLPDARKRARYRYYVKTVAHRLHQAGLIEFKKSKSGKTFLKLTEKGKREVTKYQLGELKITRPRKWDGKWRVIIFDIKEFKKGDRNSLRGELINLGFKKLQNSVWVYPYECEEVTTLLKAAFGFGREVLYLVVERLENDHWLRREFGILNNMRSQIK